MNRKKFIATSALAAISVSIFGQVNQDESGVFSGDCVTTNDILGPFYLPDSPKRKDLTYKDLKGTVILLEGQVYQDDCSTPIDGAMIEIWHANNQGRYDNKSKDFNQRAKWFSEKDGSYDFKTIFPGKYMNGSQFRPAHIHYRVTAKGYEELISQIYFSGDEHNPTDPWASQTKAESRILPLIPIDNRGNIGVKFDIYLKKK